MYTNVEDLVEYLTERLGTQPEAPNLADVLESLDDERRAAAAGGPDAAAEVDLAPLRQFAQMDGPLGDVAAIALGRFGDAGVLARLEELLTVGDAGLRRAAILSLGAIGGEKVIGPLVSIAESPKEPAETRLGAVLALGASRDLRAASALQTALQDADKDIRKFAAQALGQIGAMAGAPSAVAGLRKALRDEFRDVRMHAAEALGLLNDANCVDALAEALHDQHRAVRKHAAIALSRYGDARGLRVLADALGDVTEYGRAEVIEALVRLGGEEATKALIKGLSDEDADLRLRAVKGLAMLGDAGAIPEIRRVASEDKYAVVREAAAQALAALRFEEAPARREPPRAAAEEPGEVPAPRKRARRARPAETPPHAPAAEVIRRAIEAIGCDFEPLSEGYELIVPTPGGRKRRVRLLLNERDEEGDDLIRVKVDVGELSPRKLRLALRQNATLTCGALAIEEQHRNDLLVLTDVIPARNAAVAHLRKIIMTAAARAAQLAVELQ